MTSSCVGAGQSTERTRLGASHNPEVAGSNPAPAIAKTACKSGGFRLSGLRQHESVVPILSHFVCNPGHEVVGEHEFGICQRTVELNPGRDKRDPTVVSPGRCLQILDAIASGRARPGSLEPNRGRGGPSGRLSEAVLAAKQRGAGRGANGLAAFGDSVVGRVDHAAA
jgi:hypothetical protein